MMPAPFPREAQIHAIGGNDHLQAHTMAADALDGHIQTMG